MYGWSNDLAPEGHVSGKILKKAINSEKEASEALLFLGQLFSRPINFNRSTEYI